MKIDFFYSLNKIKSYLKQATDVLLSVIAVALLLGIIFGVDAPFVGIVYSNLITILDSIGDNGIVALVSLIIIFLINKK
ncbi:MAG: hypothetical protein ACJ0FE_04435 [Gammaproteobacteria bacterium]|jgi:hypothetical protein|tara:strand:- start:965 stop:1201 length:237 start_codon:yes stop_codon:yes gene_type:complete